MLDKIEPRPGYWTIVSSRLAAQLQASEAQLATAMRRHVDRFGAEYAAEVPHGTKIVRLELPESVSIVLIAVELQGTKASVLAVVATDEQEQGERAVGKLRRYLQSAGGAR